MKTAGALAATLPSLARRRGPLAPGPRTDRACTLARPGGPKSGHKTFALVLLGWQMALALALQHGLVGLGSFAAVHFAGCLALAALVGRRWLTAADRQRYSTALQIVAWSALAGPFGAFVAAALVLPATRNRSQIADAGVEVEPISSPERERAERVHRALLDRRIRIEGAARVRPLMDVMVEGSRLEKLDTLAVLHRRYDARLSPVLKLAMRDPDTSVRVLAATVTAKLNSAYGRKISDHQSAAVADAAVPQNWRRLAEARIDYAESGLLEGPRARTELALAIDALSRSTRLDPTDRASKKLLARARRALATWPIDPVSGTGST